MKKEPLLRIHYKDKEEGFDGWLVIDSLVDGLAGGGLRVTQSVNLSEVERLSAGMTLKNKTMGLPLGGGKSAICYDPQSPKLEDALVRFFKHVGPICKSMYGWGPDMNTPPDLCDRVAKRAGLKSRHMALAEKSQYGYAAVEKYNQALRDTYGPLTITDARTSVGVAESVLVAAKEFNLPKSLRVGIQGFGSVGMGTAYFLEEKGHQIVGVADAGGYYFSQNGMDFQSLKNAKGSEREIQRSKLSSQILSLPRSEILFCDCDVLVLAAVPDALQENHVDQLKCKLIVEGGNFAVAPSAFKSLQNRSIPVVPDFVASGGAIATVGGIIQLGWNTDPKELLDEIRSRVAQATTLGCKLAKEKNSTIRNVF